MTLVTVHDASTAYRIPKPTIYRWLTEGRLLQHGRRRRTMIDLDELDQLCEVHRPKHLTSAPS